MPQPPLDSKQIAKRLAVLSPSKKTPIKKLSNPLNIAIEILAGGITGVLIGLLFDNLFASKPICLIICIVISLAATFRTIWSKYL